jgi:hypothetical protein
MEAHQRGGRGAKFGKLKFDGRRAVASKGRKTGIFTPKSGRFGRCGKEIYVFARQDSIKYVQRAFRKCQRSAVTMFFRFAC